VSGVHGGITLRTCDANHAKCGKLLITPLGGVPEYPHDAFFFQGILFDYRLLHEKAISAFFLSAKQFLLLS
jgi:hypothetical protein